MRALAHDPARRMTTLGSPGFYGKLPARGDFVSRRMPNDFVERWDAWLQGALAESRADLGADWLEVYLTSPIWRFALAAGVCGEQGRLGVMMPSVDKVGRYFPLTATLGCEPGRSALARAFELEGWFADVENLLLATLADPPLDLEAFDERIGRLGAPDGDVDGALDAPTQRMRAGSGEREPPAGVLRRFALPPGASLRDGVQRLAADAREDPLGWPCVWWTEGSERIGPSLLVTAQLPSPSASVAMLDGRFSARGWSDPDRAAFRAPDGRARRSAAIRSAAFTDPGKARTRNEDAFASRDDLGVYVVADGLGGHQAGEIASRMVTSVVDALENGVRPDFSENGVRPQFPEALPEKNGVRPQFSGTLPAYVQEGCPRASLAERVDRFARALRVVNGCLQVLAERQPGVELAASTVAALFVQGETWACVWAGDSRVYRLRDGELRQLSRDHSEAEEVNADNHVVTRAVGAPDPLEVDVEHGDARPGDRFLLCTDGLYGEVAPEEIAAALALAEPEQACARLMTAALRGEAPDNLTGIVVHLEALETEAGEP
ncbi:MAG TPA: type VI secretion system-associated protein TagF [Gammaproteobacteria bacterium]|nr:type VI secretion system-associated protein TagF [Gammaproteobacteria bacterium]